MTQSNRVVSTVIVGARGRMGKALIQEILLSDDLALSAAVDHDQAPGLGEDVGSLHGLGKAYIPLTAELELSRANVVIDFSLPQATSTVLDACCAAKVPLVLGTTGHDTQTIEHIELASEQIPIVHAANYSVGVTVMLKLAALAAKALGTGWDTEIFELHHRHKRDAPSGTALRIGKAVADATGRKLEDTIRTVRDGDVGPRTREEIGIMTLRGGDAIGEHTLMLLSASERLELTHRATDRQIFAKGALRAARWVQAHTEPGLYDMPDVLGIGD